MKELRCDVYIPHILALRLSCDELAIRYAYLIASLCGLAGAESDNIRQHPKLGFGGILHSQLILNQFPHRMLAFMGENVYSISPMETA
jgi:hypothetical protein